MREYPTVYVVNDLDGGAVAAYYHKSEAIKYCNDRLNEWYHDDEDKPNWEAHFEITKLKVW